ncbi:MAG: hypothetical protein ACRCWY_04235 [Cellulosilyticaceae bacterium]
MEEAKMLKMIAMNPSVIKTIPNPTDEMKRLAVTNNGLTLQYIKNPTPEIERLALENNRRAIRFIQEPTEEMMCMALEGGWALLQDMKAPTEKVVRQALEQSGWAIQYVKEPSEEMQLLAVEKNEDAIRYIKTPSRAVQQVAVSKDYGMLRYIEKQDSDVRTMAVRDNEAAVSLMIELTKEEILGFLKVNSLVIKYVAQQLTKEEVEEALIEVIKQEQVEEKYIRDLLNCKTLDVKSSIMPIDKMQLIYQYGSKQAKKIAVDERLKME